MPITSHKQIDFFNNVMGLNTMKSGILLSHDEFRDCQDIDLFPIGGWSKRNGYSLLNSTPVGSSSCNGLFMARYSLNGGTNIFYLVSGTKLYKMTSGLGGTWTDITGGLTITNNANYIWHFDILNDICVLSNGVDTPIQIDSSGTATAFPSMPFTTYKFSFVSRGYIFYCVPTVVSDGLVHYDRMYFSDINNPVSVDENNYIDVSKGTGGDLRGGVEYKTYAYAFKRNGIHQVAFSPTQINSAGDLFPWIESPNPIVPGVGVGSHRSIVKFTTPATHQTPGQEYVFFIDQFGVPRIFDGTTTISLSSKFNSSRDTTILSLSDMDRTRTPYCFAVNYPEKNKLLFFLSKINSQQDTCWVMDYNIGFSITRNKYASPFNCGWLFEKPDGSYKPYYGDYAGSVVESDAGTTDNGEVINDYVLFGDSYISSPSLRNKWFLMSVRGQTGGSDQNIKVSFYIDGNDTPVVIDKLLTLQTDQTQWGAFVWGQDSWAKLGLLTRSLEINLEAKTLKVKIESDDKLNDTYLIEGFSLEGQPTGTSEV